MISRVWNIIQLPLVVLMVVVVFAFAKARHKQTKINEVSITFTASNGLFITENTVNKLLIQKSDTLASSRVEILDLKEMESRVLQNAMVENAIVYKTLNGNIGAVVQQRTPIARLLDQQKYMDREHFLMPLSPVYTARVPLVTGYSEENAAEVFDFLTYVGEDEFLKRWITGIRMSGRDATLLVRDGTYEVKYGRLDKYESKFMRLDAFLKHAKTESKLEQYKQIDLRYAGQVIGIK